MHSLSRWIATSALCLPFLTACSEESKQETQAAGSKMADATKDMAHAVEGAAKEMGDAAAAKFKEIKDAFAKDSEGKASSFDSKIEELKKKASKAAGESKAELDLLMTRIKEKRTELGTALTDLKSKGETAFESAKTSVQTKISELQKLVDDATSKAK